jgi:hypothetical protein
LASLAFSAWLYKPKMLYLFIWSHDSQAFDTRPSVIMLQPACDGHLRGLLAWWNARTTGNRPGRWDARSDDVRSLAYAAGDLTPPNTSTAAESAAIGMSLTETNLPGSRSGRIIDSIQSGPCLRHRSMKAASSDARLCLMAVPHQGEDTTAEQASSSDIVGVNSRQSHSAAQCRLIA